ncbi:MAG TPA: PAS domain-containing protein [Bryobacteraceae bacterium]|jgi:aerotaxis receptor
MPPISPQATRPNIIDESRVFEIQELFFSTTDKRGRIRSSNEIFVRVSGFPAGELRNRPHNIIRHPDMPRVIFQLLWSEIESEREILAYVKNRAKDGRYYWVVALVSPIEGGYLSVRFKPSSELFPVVRNLYRELGELESSAENAGAGKAAGMVKSRAALDDRLHELGFADYRAFMHSAFERELRSREAALMKRRGGYEKKQTDGDSTRKGTAADAARGVVVACEEALSALARLFNELEVYSSLNEGIRSKAGFVASLSHSIRMLSLNGTVEAEQLGTTGCGIGRVLDWLQTFSSDIREGCDNLTTPLARLNSDINSVIFALNSAKLQIEMTTDFAVETLRAAAGDTGQKEGIESGAMRDLYGCSRNTVERALAALAAVEGKLHALDGVQRSIWKSIRSLRLIYLKGKIELASVASERLGIVFDDMNRHLTDTEGNLSALESLIEELHKELRRGVQHSAPIERAVRKIDPGAAEGAADSGGECTAA